MNTLEHSPLGALDSGQPWLQRYQGALMGTYGVPARVLVRGQGCYVWDNEGNRYLDMLAGIAVNALGHAHPLLISAVTSQLATLGHVSNLFAHPLQIALAEKLLQLADAPSGSAVFFCNSGAEASEAVIKLSRRTGRTRLVAAHGGFHGRTMGALALTAKPAYREPFEPLPGHVQHVPFGDVDALAATLDETVAAVVLEPVQGEGGVRPAPSGYLAQARELTRAVGALLVLDEVQTGIGRTGAWFAHQLPDLGLPADAGPDVMTLAKGLGGGIPIGAVLAYGPSAQLLSAGQHGSTFGGNPVAAAAALATLHVVERDGLVAAAADQGERLRRGVLGLGHALVSGVRGHGLLLGVELSRPVSGAVSAALLANGVIANAVDPSTLRLAPPLVIGGQQIEQFLQALDGALHSVARQEAL